MDAFLSAAVVALVALVALIPVAGTIGAFGFPAAVVWPLLVGPVLLVLLARGGGEPGDPDA